MDAVRDCKAIGPVRKMYRVTLFEQVSCKAIGPVRKMYRVTLFEQVSYMAAIAKISWYYRTCLKEA